MLQFKISFVILTVAIKLTEKTTVPLLFDNLSSCTLSSHRHDIFLIALFGETSQYFLDLQLVG